MSLRKGEHFSFWTKNGANKNKASCLHTYTPRLFFWVVADNTPRYHELSTSSFEQSYLVLLAHVDKGPYLFGHSDDSLDGKVSQVYHTHQVVRILLGRRLLLKREEHTCV